MKRILLLLAAVALLAIGCKKTPEINNLGESKIILPAEGGSAYLNFATNCAWDANVLDAWAQITPISGPANANAKITVTAAANTDSAPRSTTLTVIAEGEVLQVTVTQEAAMGELLVDGAVYEVPNTGGQLTVPVQANVDYTVTPDADWITVVQSKVLQNYTIVLECAGNPTGNERSSTVTVAGGGQTKTFTVHQAACEYITIVSVWSQKDDMMLDAKDLITVVRGWGGAGYRQAGFTALFTTELTDCDFDILCAEDAQGWVNKTYDTYFDEYNQKWSFYFELSSNSGYEPRTGHIRIVDKNTGYVSNELTVYQVGLPAHAIDMGLNVYWHEFNLGATAPEDYGDYYAWGELEPKTAYTWDTYSCHGGDRYTTYDNGYTYCLWDEDDAASVKLGYDWDGAFTGQWHMPTEYEFEELIATRNQTDTYKWVWKTINGHNGWEITYLVNGNSIFLPAAGYIYGGSESLSAGSLGLYWSAYPVPYVPTKSYYLRFEPGPDGEVAVYNDGERAAGKPIRPVTY